MATDLVQKATEFVYANGRLLERLRLEVLLGTGSRDAVARALRVYRNEDGGFGHALEPDVRAPTSEPASTLSALEVLAEVGALDDPMVADAARWLSRVARPDGGVPFVLPGASGYPHAPWMTSAGEGSMLTFALAGHLWRAGSESEWLERATRWCWDALDDPTQVGGYVVKFALEFLDRVPDGERAAAVVTRLGGVLAPDGSLPVLGGLEEERLGVLDLSPRPASRSRALFDERHVELALDRLAAAQADDGGWTFDWLAWSAGQAVEWRGVVTIRALATLRAHDRL